jgi:protein SCO1/2
LDRRKLLLLALAAFAVALGAAAAYRFGAFDRPQQTALVGGPFQLVDQTGRPVDETVLNGKWSAVFFGFTYCPEACPTTLVTLARAQDLLGPRGKSLQPVFISVDPARDTPRQMALYLSNDAFPKGTLGLTGTVQQTDAAAKAYRVFHQKSGEGPGYLIDHSTVTYLMSPKGRFVCAIPYGLTPEQAAERIKKAMREGPDATAC